MINQINNPIPLNKNNHSPSFPPGQSKIASFQELRSLNNGGIERLRPSRPEDSGRYGLTHGLRFFPPGQSKIASFREHHSLNNGGIERFQLTGKTDRFPYKPTHTAHTSFKGPIDGAAWFLEQCNVHPMVGVSFIDGVTAIAPRTYVDAKTNGFAAAETFRRESSGLIVNCLIPGFVVLGAAKAMEWFKGGMKDVPEDVKLSNLWANEDSMKEFHSRWAASGKSGSKYIDKFIDELHVNKGTDWVSFNKEHEKQAVQVKKLLKEILTETNGKSSKNLKEAEKIILEATGGAERIKLGKNAKIFGTNLNFALRDSIDCGRIFKKLKPAQFDGFLEKAVKFTNNKSRLGLLVVIPLAASMQSINRWITRKSSGKEGAPIYKDFLSNETKKELTPKEKTGFWVKKLGAAALMVGVAFASLKDRSSLKGLKMLQFNEKLPSMDQCRWIATTTFASRMLAAEDENELREVTFRDIATFCALYFCGDYVSKGTASLIKKFTKGKVNLLNETKELAKGTKLGERFKHWVSETKLKSFAESRQAGGNARNWRALCEITSLGFSLLLLGTLVPWYVRKQTDSKRKEELETKMKQYHSFPSILHFGQDKKVFQAFGMNNTAKTI